MKRLAFESFKNLDFFSTSSTKIVQISTGYLCKKHIFSGRLVTTLNHQPVTPNKHLESIESQIS